MFLAVALFLTLGQALGISEESRPLFCADRITFTLRESSTSQGCLENERSLGANAITKSKVGASGIHPKVNLRFKVAERAAREEGINLYITSGFRTLERQHYLFERAVIKYGSAKEAAKWVLPPNVSNHPRGLALDINYPGDKSGAAWLAKYGYRFGLCRVFDNEWWHFEANTAPGKTCPPRLAHAGKLLD
jgi:zinc D-Ala-D-Ala carboxypeptidase